MNQIPTVSILAWICKPWRWLAVYRTVALLAFWVVSCATTICVVSGSFVILHIGSGALTMVLPISVPYFAQAAPIAVEKPGFELGSSNFTPVSNGSFLRRLGIALPSLHRSSLFLASETPAYKGIHSTFQRDEAQERASVDAQEPGKFGYHFSYARPVQTTTQYWRPVLVCQLPVGWVGLLFLIGPIRRSCIRWYRLRHGRCAGCGYCLSGAVSDCCSECGAPIPIRWNQAARDESK